jgi:hypothetical protein
VCKTPQDFESKIETLSTDFEKKVFIARIFDTPNLKLNTPEWKTALRKYTTEILQIREVNAPFATHNPPSGPLPFTPGWKPSETVESQEG